MSRRRWRKEQYKQTMRLYKLITTSKNIDNSHLEEEVKDCIKNGADLSRRIYGRDIIVWEAIVRGYSPVIIKILIEAGGLFENIRIINRCTYTQFSDRKLYYTKSLEWEISENFDDLDDRIQRIRYRIDEDEVKEFIERLHQMKQRYEEYKELFDIEKFDLNFCRKNGYYD